MSESPVLITIPISHYCEKARWALERAGIEYQERAHLQVIHWIAVTRAGGKRTAPVLVWGDRVFADSADIVEEASAKAPPQRQLFPEDPAAAAEVRELQNDFDIRLGPEGRRWPLPQPEELPAAMAATVRELRTHPAGARANDVPRRAALLSLGGVDRRPGGSQAIVSQKSLAATTSASTSASP